MATPQQVRDLTTAQPFRPFRVHTSGGRTFEVKHPENIAIAPGGREMVIFDGEDLIHIEALMAEVLDPIKTTKGPDGNGE